MIAQSVMSKNLPLSLQSRTVTWLIRELGGTKPYSLFSTAFMKDAVCIRPFMGMSASFFATSCIAKLAASASLSQSIMRYSLTSSSSCLSSALIFSLSPIKTGLITPRFFANTTALNASRSCAFARASVFIFFFSRSISSICLKDLYILLNLARNKFF